MGETFHQLWDNKSLQKKNNVKRLNIKIRFIEIRIYEIEDTFKDNLIQFLRHTDVQLSRFVSDVTSFSCRTLRRHSGVKFATL